MVGLLKNGLTGKETKGRRVFLSFGEKEKGEKNLFPISYENCDCRGGRLRGGIGLEQCLDEQGEPLTMGSSSNSSVPRVFFTTLSEDGVQAPTQAVYVVATDGYLYMRLENGEPSRKVYVGNNVTHCAMKGEDKAIYNFFCGDKSVFATANGTDFRCVKTVDNVGVCICKKRCFILTKNGELVYSAALNLFAVDSNDPDDVGTIYLPAKYGAPVGMKEYEGKIYLFFERGICKLSVSAKPTENVIEELGYHGGTICLRGQAVSSEGILFLAQEGAYYLRNDRVERVCEYLPIGPCEVGVSCDVGYCEELVIFSYHKQKDGASAPCRLVLYADGKDGYFTEEYGLLSGNEYTYLNGKFYRYAKDGEGILRGQTPSFSGEEIDFSSSKTKRLKRLLLKGEGRVTVGVQCGERERKYPLFFQNGVARTRLLDKGRAFSFHFYLEAGSSISGVEIEYVTGG